MSTYICMYVYVCVYIYIHVCMYVCMYVWDASSNINICRENLHKLQSEIPPSHFSRTSSTACFISMRADSFTSRPMSPRSSKIKCPLLILPNSSSCTMIILMVLSLSVMQGEDAQRNYEWIERKIWREKGEAKEWGRYRDLPPNNNSTADLETHNKHPSLEKEKENGWSNV